MIEEFIVIKKFIAMSESSHNYEFSASKCHLKIIGDTYA